MLEKLKLKFIFINMTIVTIMLIAIFGLLYYSTRNNLERESIQMMKSVASNPMQIGQPNAPNDSIRIPYFTVVIDYFGQIIDINGGFFNISDYEYLNELLMDTINTHTTSGILKEYNLRFLISNGSLGRCFVYADMTSEQSTLNNLIRTFLVIGSSAFFVFLLISILFSRWSIKPVDLAWKQQKQFIADASHELKTPLTVIMTDAELLSDSNCPKDEQTTLSKNILSMSIQMKGLVENMLDLARIDNESVKEEFSITSFSDIICDASMIFEPLFFEKSLSLQYDIQPNIQINGISSHLNQLINILLDNAQKYSSTNGKTMIHLNHRGHKHCLLEVSNQGDPIQTEDLKNLFTRFYRGDKARSMNHSYGLGLSIAKSIVEEHHGKIWAESNNGYNCFYVEMPCLNDEN